MQLLDSRRRLVMAAVAAALVISVGACAPTTETPSATPGGSPGASANPTAGPSSSPAPTPSASPSTGARTDPVAGFRTRFAGGFAAEADITGELTIGGIAYPITGSYQVRGGDNHLVMNLPGAPTTETLAVGGVSYERRGGLWFERPASPGAASGGLASAMRAVLDVRDAGVVARDGGSLHHLVPRTAAPLPLSTLGIANASDDGSVSIEFFVEDDGTLRVMALGATWTPTGSTEPVSMSIEYAFGNIGGAISIERPDRTWATFSSKRFAYSLAYPSDWEPQTGRRKNDPDVLVTAGEAGVYVYRTPSEGYSLNALTSDYVAQIKRNGAKATIVSNRPAAIDGEKARRVEWTAVFDGRRSWGLDAVVVRGRFVYVFDYAMLTKPTAADRADFDAIVSTIDLTAGNATGSSATLSAA